MSTALSCLVLFAGWAIALVLAIGAVRVSRVLRRLQPANSFTSGVPHGGDRYWRLNRAHLNTLENLPIFGALVLAGEATGLRTGSFATAAIVVVAARVVQSLTHIASNANQAVNLRFTAYVTQLGGFIWMLLELFVHKT